jgi:hypothetical protein
MSCTPDVKSKVRNLTNGNVGSVNSKAVLMRMPENDKAGLIRDLDSLVHWQAGFRADRLQGAGTYPRPSSKVIVHYDSREL